MHRSDLGLDNGIPAEPLSVTRSIDNSLGGIFLLCVPKITLRETSNKIIQKELAFVCETSGSVAVLDEAASPCSGILPRRLARQCGASVVTARDAVSNQPEDPVVGQFEIGQG